MPKTGWEGHQQLNHFQLVEQLVNHSIYYKGTLTALLDEENEQRILNLITNEFTILLSENRRTLIVQYLKYRFMILRSLIKMPTND